MASGKEGQRRLSRAELRRAKRFHRSRPARARKLDEARLSKRVTYDVEKWMRAPDRYDLPGVDTPDAAEWRRKLAEAMKARMSKVKQAPIAWCEVKRSKGKYAVICWHDLGGNVYYPVMHGAFEREFDAIERAMKLRKTRKMKQSEFLDMARRIGRILAKETKTGKPRFGVIRVRTLTNENNANEVIRRIENVFGSIALLGKRERVKNEVIYEWYVDPQKLASMSDSELRELAKRMKIPNSIVSMYLTVDKSSAAAPLVKALGGGVKVGKCKALRLLMDYDNSNDVALLMFCKEGKLINNNVTYFNSWLKFFRAVSQGFLEASKGRRSG